MLELNQKIYLPLHKTIGTVVWKGEEGGSAKGEFCIKTNENYNVWTDNLGLLAHTELQIAIPIKFTEGEQVLINDNGFMHFGVIKEAAVDTNGELVYIVHFEHEKIHTIKPSEIVSMESLLDIAIKKHNINCEKGIARQKYFLKKITTDEKEKD